MLISAARLGDRWEEDVLAVAPDFNRNWHRGDLTGAEEAADRLSLKVNLALQGDYWARGGPASYVISLSRGADGLSGTYEGTFRGAAVSGRATAVAPKPIDALAPAQPGEHPRLLFRRDDIPAIRRRAATPQGQAVLQRLRALLAQRTESASMVAYAPGHALLYVLTGEQREAQMALNLARHSLENDPVSSYYPSNCWGLLNIAVTYDLCYDAWDEESRVAVGNELRRRTRDLLTFYDSHGYRHEAPWWHVTMTRSTAGLCAIAVLGDPAHTGSAEMPTLRKAFQPQGFAPGRGVPVVPFANSQCPDAWLFAGPFPLPRPPAFSTQPPDIDFLAGLGGRDRAAPSAGTQVVWDQIIRTFQRLGAQFLTLDAGGNLRIEAWEACGETPLSVCYFYTVIRNDKPRYVMPTFGSRGCAVWVGGQQIRERQPFLLGEGHVPVMIQTVQGKTRNWETQFAAARFEELPEGNATGYIEHLREERRRGILVSDPPLRRQYRGARVGLQTLPAEMKVMRGGPGSTRELVNGLADGLLPFVLASRNALALDVRIPGDDFLRTPWAFGAPAWQDIGAVAPGLAEEMRQNRSVMARGLFLCPPEAMAQARPDFDRIFGLEGDGSFAIVHPLDAIFVLAHYPAGR